MHLKCFEVLFSRIIYSPIFTILWLKTLGSTHDFSSIECLNKRKVSRVKFTDGLYLMKLFIYERNLFAVKEPG
jgi:hypothetical protein